MKVLNVIQHHLGKDVKVDLGRVRVPPRLVVEYGNFDVIEAFLLGQ